MKLPSISPIRFGRGTCFPARDAESRGAIASDRNYVHRMSNFVFQLIRSRTARQITGDRNNYTETTPTESAYCNIYFRICLCTGSAITAMSTENPVVPSVWAQLAPVAYTGAGPMHRDVTRKRSFHLARARAKCKVCCFKFTTVRFTPHAPCSGEKKKHQRSNGSEISAAQLGHE